VAVARGGLQAHFGSGKATGGGREAWRVVRGRRGEKSAAGSQPVFQLFNLQLDPVLLGEVREFTSKSVNRAKTKGLKTQRVTIGSKVRLNEGQGNYKIGNFEKFE
jgi:hypothetical protein